MSEPKDMSNHELSALLADVAKIAADIADNMEFAAQLAEAARRIALLPDIWDTDVDGRLPDESKVVAIKGEEAIALQYDAEHAVFYDEMGCEYVAENLSTRFVILDDIATWVKGVKG